MKKEFCDVDEYGDNKTWHVIEILFRREYWSRVWILQEIVLPPKVYLMCGSIVCDMRFAMLLALWIHRRLDCETPMIMDRNLWERLASSSFTMKNTLLFTYQLIRHTGSKQRFPIVDQDVADRTKVFKDDFDILNEFSARETTLPEDMIYGVLGLIDFQIEPDYTRPVEATFLEVARIGVERGRLDYILSNAGLGASHRLKKQRKVRVRSWVPEWTTAWDSRHMRYPYYSANQSANLDTSLQAHVNEQGILSIFGVSIGRIRTALLPASRPSLFNIVIDLINDIDIREQYEASMGIPPLQAVIRLLLMDYETHRDTQMRRIDPKLFSSQIDFVNMVRRLMPSSDNGEFLPSWKKSLSCMRLHLNCFGPSFAEWILGPDLVDGNLFATMTFRQAVMQCTESYPSFHWRRPKEENYCIFVTDRGLIGFGPDKMMSSDQLIVCLHCQLPLLLREIPGGGYHLVGTCFVLGLMDGEAFRDNPICTLFKIH